MNRRGFLSLAGAGLVTLNAAATKPMPIGINTYCLRALRWNDRKLLEYAAGLKLDAVFLQDSLDPEAMNPSHWADVRAWSKDLGLHLETGGGGVFPKTPDAFHASVDTIRKNIERAKAMGSPIVRCILASERSALPPGSVDQHIETAVKLFRAVKPQVVDAGLKLAVEVHKDLQAWEFQQLIEAAGKDFVGIYMDTGNPVFVLEHPLTTLETLAPYIVTLHLRDSIIYEHKRGVAVHWVPLGEGVIDFKESQPLELCPMPSTLNRLGRPAGCYEAMGIPRRAGIWQSSYRWQSGIYENHVVVEDLQDGNWFLRYSVSTADHERSIRKHWTWGNASPILPGGLLTRNK
ncbi:MAG: TIM barrel protein [Bryobacteraceae bacterium]